MSIQRDDELKPAVGTCLCKNGCVVEHGRLVDSMGGWHGLLCLVVQDDDGDWPDMHLWLGMLPAEAEIKMVMMSDVRTGQVSVYYRLEPPSVSPLGNAERNSPQNQERDLGGVNDEHLSSFNM